MTSEGANASASIRNDAPRNEAIATPVTAAGDATNTIKLANGVTPADPPSPFVIVPARTRVAFVGAVSLFRQYAAWLNIDLSFQDFEAEFASVPGKYAPEKGGEIFLAYLASDIGQGAVGKPAGVFNGGEAVKGSGHASGDQGDQCPSGSNEHLVESRISSTPIDKHALHPAQHELAVGRPPLPDAPHNAPEPIGCIALRDITSAVATFNDPITYTPGRRIAEVKRLYVRPEGRKLGVGRALVKGILQTARQLGYQEVLLDTLSSMTGAIKLYKQFGFVETTKYYDTTLEGTLFMRCVLEKVEP